jgi:hypothetical protein
MADLLKTKMEGILDALGQPMRLYDTSGALDEQSVLEIDYRPAWNELCRDVDFLLSEDAEYSEVLGEITQVGPLLTTNWHQDHPYNLFCPVGDSSCRDCCPDDGDPFSYCPPHSRTVLGCVATAVAQIMKYWNWPPYGVGSHSYNWDGDSSCPAGGSGRSGNDEQTLSADFSDEYDWLNMPDILTNESNQNDFNAVANLCYEIGVSFEMDYGVCGSGIEVIRASSYINYYRYSSSIKWKDRCYPDPNDPNNKKCFNQEQWFDAIKEQLNANQPIQYFIPGHSIVVDGWQDVTGKKYHINYGWGNENTTMWYNLDEIFQGSPNEEFMLISIKPYPFIGDSLTLSNYSKSSLFPYRYFIQDANSVNVHTFAAGQNLQFLPRVRVKCISENPNHYIRFEGGSNPDTRLFSIKGTKKAEILIKDGAIKLHPGGGIRFF